jgi:lipopolysaccharide export system protein LptA
MGVKMKQLISVLEKIHKELKVNNAIESCKLIINFKQSDFKSENDKMIRTQMPIIIKQLSNINESIFYGHNRKKN